MSRSFTLPLAALVLLASTASAQAVYYSIDVENDVLCIVNSTSGVATPLGPLHIDVANVDLAWCLNALYMRTQGTAAGNKICQIVTDGAFGGMALQGNFLNGGGYQGNEVGGLASNGTTLYLTYSTSNPNDFLSLDFGSVEPISGTITHLVDLTNDIDCMGFSNGKFYGVDPTDDDDYTFWGATAAPTTLLGTHAQDNSLDPLDVEHFTLENLLAVSVDGLHLVKVKKATGERVGTAVPVTGLLPGGKLMGLARKPNPCNFQIIAQLDL